MIGSILIFLLVGLVAGWLAGLITRGHGFGWIGNLIIGVIGALIGGFLFPLLGLAATNLLGQILFALGGAILLLIIINLIRRLT